MVLAIAQRAIAESLVRQRFGKGTFARPPCPVPRTCEWLRSLLVLLFVFLFACGIAAFPDRAGSSEHTDTSDANAESVCLEQGFREPPDAARPWVYWWWLNGNVTRQSITRDLSQMKQKGIGGLLMLDSRGYHDDILPPPASRMGFMSPRWREMLKFAIATANRLDLEMSVNISSGAGALKGPWNVGDGAPKELIWAAHTTRGARHLRCDLRPAEREYFRDVAVMAVRHGEQGDAKGQPAVLSRNEVGSLNGNWQPIAPRLDRPLRVVEVVDLSGKVDARGRLTWNVPGGVWTLLRFACVVMKGHENDVDILDKNAVEIYFNRIGHAILREAGASAGTTLSHFYNVSWEGAAPTWTRGFDGSNVIAR